MKKLLAMMLAGAVSVSAAAEEDVVKSAQQAAMEAEMLVRMAEINSPWLLIAGASDAEYYINGESITLVKQPYKTILTNTGPPKFVDKYVKTWWKEEDNNGKTIKIQTYIYCNDDMYQNSGGFVYDVNGHPEDKVPPQHTAHPIVPDSVMSIVAKFSCKLKN